MKSFRLCALAAALPAAAAVTPLNKVISMLDGMLEKGKVEKHEEEVEFAKYKVWCDNTRQETQKSIDQGGAQIVQLQADMDKANSDAEVLAGEVEVLDADIAKAKGEAKSAKAVRDKENADYLVQFQDYSESIDACERAVAVLKARSADVPQSLAQVKASPMVPSQAKALLDSFLAMHSDADAQAAPEANAYEFQSGSVVGMIEKLTIRFKDERLALEKAEMNAKHNHEMLMQQLTDNIKASTDASNEKSAMRASRMKDAASAEGDLEMTEKAKAEDEKTLSDTNTECHMKSKEFEENQVTRADEVKAIEQAISILSSDEVKGNAETYLPSLLQGGAKAKVRALAQLRSAASKGDDTRARAVAYLQRRAQKLGSRYLSVMAERCSEDPFGKVKKMIKDLIVKLMEEANAEADHHAYCTSELATNKQTRDDKSAEVEKLTAETEGLTAQAAELGMEITELSDSMAELQGTRAESTKLRAAEKETNAKTVADAKAAQLAVQQAISVLRSFYDAQKEGASSLLQARAKGAKGREPYKGMGAESGGILGMLDVVLSDFARLETETSSTEDAAARAYEKFMDESTEELEVKETTRKHKEGKKQQTEERLRSSKKELGLTQEELDAALDYYDKLKQECLDTNLSYEERVKMREEEIQSLKEALKILNGEELA